jgi:hypothetical protein
MTNNNKNIYAAEPLATGVAFVGPLGTAAPTDAVTAVDVAMVDLGYTGTDGFTEKNDRRTDLKRSFGGKVVKVVQTEYSASLDFTLMESLNGLVLKAIFGTANVTLTAATVSHGAQVRVLKNGRKLPHQAWCIDTTDEETGAKYRNWVSDGQITTVADIKVVHSDVIEYRITIECFETEAGNDNIITLTDDGQFASS